MNTTLDNFLKEECEKKYEVYESEDYDQFHTLVGNRIPNPQHIERLRFSLQINGMIPNPLLVNEDFEIVDGQHRFEAAKKARTKFYYIIVDYKLSQVHAINQDQSNYSVSDYMHGFADTGNEHYITLKRFYDKHKVFNLTDCIAMLSNVSSNSQFLQSEKYRANRGGMGKTSETFNEGTWKVRDLEKGELWATNLHRTGKYFSGYTKSSFIATMIMMFKHPEFDFEDFIKKLHQRPFALSLAANRSQYKVMVEDIYNYRRKVRINLRY